MEQIIAYLKEAYDPISIILYGSYASGTHDANSDLDALVISYDHERFHDTSFVNGIQLDVFVYPASYFDGEFPCEDFLHIADGKIIVDHDGFGTALQGKLCSHLQSRPPKSKAEIDANVDWCVKMLARAKRNDAEGMFRWHWVLTDSLEIFCDIMGHPYFGPKKTLRWMEEQHPAAFGRYKAALEEFRIDRLEDWIAYLKDTNRLT